MNDKNINKNSTQSGRSMIEILGVLAIVGVLSVGGIAGYSKAMEKFKINKTICKYLYGYISFLCKLDSISKKKIKIILTINQSLFLLLFVCICLR